MTIRERDVSIAELNRQIENLTADKIRLHRNWSAVRKAEMCLVCGETRFRDGRPMEDGNSIMGHIRGCKDEAHVNFRKGMVGDLEAGVFYPMQATWGKGQA